MHQLITYCSIRKAEDNTHGNGLGVGRNANMGDFNPFSLKCTENIRNFAYRTYTYTNKLTSSNGFEPGSLDAVTDDLSYYML